MVNPGAFKGARKEFLLGEKPAYALGVEEKYAADALALIQRRFLKRFPIDLPDDVEPTAEELAAVDDEAPDPEIEEPDAEKLTHDEYLAAVEQQIRRWMAYQYEKDHNLSNTDSGVYNPYRRLMFKLTGFGADRPRLKTAANTWRKTQRAEIEAEVARFVQESENSTWASDPSKKKASLISIRDRVAREMFKSLPDEERRFWQLQATAEHEAAVKEWKDEVEGPISTDPAERQRCIQRLVGFTQPILDLISECTGWKASMIVGGPEPAMGGQLSVVSIHSGTTTGDVKMNFGRAERARFRNVVVPMYGAFLRKGYTPEVCKARALPSEEGHLPLSDMDLSTSDFDAIPWDGPIESSGLAQAKGTTPPQAIRSTPALPTPTPTPVASSVSTVSAAAASDSANTLVGSSRPVVSASAANNTVSAPRNEIGNSTASDRLTATPTAASLPVGSQPCPAVSTAPPAPTAPPLKPTGEAGGQADKDRMDTDAPSPGPFPFELESSPPPASCPPSPLPSPAHSPAPSPTRAAVCLAPDAPNASQQGTLAAPAPMVIAEGAASSPPLAVSAEREAMDGVGDGTPPLTVTKGGRRLSRRSAAQARATIGEKAALEAGGKRRAEDSEPSVQDRPRKKKRTSKAATSIETPPVVVDSSAEPTPAPPWFTKAKSMLDTPELGSEWKDLVRKWMAFESLEGYKAASNLSAVGRPVAVKDWIQRARSPVWQPNSLDVNAYGNQFTDWWASLQPEERQKKGVSVSEVEDWDGVRKGGVNGLLSVMAALFFWGLAAQKKGKAQEKKWLHSLQDVGAVIGRLVAAD